MYLLEPYSFITEEESMKAMFFYVTCLPTSKARSTKIMFLTHALLWKALLIVHKDGYPFITPERYSDITPKWYSDSDKVAEPSPGSEDKLPASEDETVVLVSGKEDLLMDTGVAMPRA